MESSCLGFALVCGAYLRKFFRNPATEQALHKIMSNENIMHGGWETWLQVELALYFNKLAVDSAIEVHRETQYKVNVDNKNVLRADLILKSNKNGRSRGLPEFTYQGRVVNRPRYKEDETKNVIERHYKAVKKKCWISIEIKVKLNDENIGLAHRSEEDYYERGELTLKRNASIAKIKANDNTTLDFELKESQHDVYTDKVGRAAKGKKKQLTRTDILIKKEIKKDAGPAKLKRMLGPAELKEYKKQYTRWQLIVNDKEMYANPIKYDWSAGYIVLSKTGTDARRKGVWAGLFPMIDDSNRMSNTDWVPKIKDVEMEVHNNLEEWYKKPDQRILKQNTWDLFYSYYKALIPNERP